jgi:hypothetical protein
MKEFEIKSQVKLPTSKCMEVVLSGIRFRLFRASITMSIIALAVAFLMTIMGDSLIVREVTRSVERLVRPRQEYLFWSRHLVRPMQSEELIHLLADLRPDEKRWRELRAFGGLTDDAMSELTALARREIDLLRRFDAMKESHLRALVGRERGRGILRELAARENLNDFFEALPELNIVWNDTQAEFESFLQSWQARQPWRDAILRGHAQAAKKVRKLMGNRSPLVFLSDLSAERAAAIREFGLLLPAETVAALAERARHEVKAQTIDRFFQNPSVRQRFVLRFGLQDVNQIVPQTVFSRLATRDGAAWLEETARSLESEAFDIESAEIRRTAEHWLRERQLANMETAALALGVGDGFMGFSNRVLWLVVVSLIVCVVGIANAMLMSVTERFKEIATMKCLGATDGFIMTNFIMESGIQGLAGGVIGSVLGLILGIVRASLSYGRLALTSLPVASLALVWLFAILAGIVLSMLAAIYPARAAAQLAPLEAMRVE